MGRTRGFAMFAVGVAVGGACLAAPIDEIRSSQGGSAPLARTYHKQRLSLKLDATRVAVRGEAAAILKALREVGLHNSSPTRAELHGWWMAPLAAASTQSDVERLVGELAGQPGLERVSPVFFDDLGGPAWIAGDLMIGFGTDLAAAERDAVIAASKCGTLRQRDYTLGVDRITPASRNGLEILATANALAERDDVLFAEPDWAFTGRGLLIPNDVSFGDLWGIHNTGQAGGTIDQDMDGPEAWDITPGSNAIIVTVLDTGIEPTHPDLNIAPGADFTGSPALAGAPGNNCDIHGTPVASSITARINNVIGVVGIAPGCRSSSARIGVSGPACDNGWSGFISATIDALNFAQAAGHRVTNNSNGYGFTSAAIEAAYQNTYDAGLVHFAAAGNGGTSSVGYPASIPVINAVSAIQRSGNLAAFSSYGVGTDFAAPGEGIVGCDRLGTLGYSPSDFAVFNGTSFASPYAAGVAALVLSNNPFLTSAQVEAVMRNSAVDRGLTGHDQVYGAGFVNAFAAVQASAPPVPANDLCANAIDVSAGGVFVGTLDVADNDGTSACGDSSANPDVWFRFTAASCPVWVNFNTCGTHDISGTDTVLSVFNACGGAEIVCNDDALGALCGALDIGLLADSYLFATVNPGQTVYIRVSHRLGFAPGPFVLRVDTGIANDVCVNALPIAASAPTTFCTTGANTDGPTEVACQFFSSNNVSQDVWYRYTPVGKGRFTVRTCGSGFDTKVAIYPNICPGAPGTVLACADDSNECGNGSFNTSVSAIGAAGTPYLIRLGGYLTSAGAGIVRVYCAADVNFSGAASVQDIFDFLELYFANNPRADINGAGGLTVQDIFDFLETYFSGC